jgi:hypothetical protein
MMGNMVSPNSPGNEWWRSPFAWTVIGAIAGVISAIATVIAVVPHHPNPQPSPAVTAPTLPVPSDTSAPVPTPVPTPTITSVGQLPDACGLPRPDVVTADHLTRARASVTGSSVGCSWSAQPDGWGQGASIQLTEHLGPYTPASGWVPVTIPGISGAYEEYDQAIGSCFIIWNTSWGGVMAAANNGVPSSADPRAALEEFAADVSPHLPP